ncbi:ImcF-related family protein [Aquitalea magnusonii]|uniref:Type VI secretion system protein ImpL n=1 Tax=Aquitalea magnusonii TaxID=332411 RepID=A0A318JNZ2_9NEIS|nr:ImcF-related family protein [Aquitalea magnusonii]PXX49594.1 type VI secretion system protein ImpL [Aquitalea magnusonii]
MTSLPTASPTRRVYWIPLILFAIGVLALLLVWLYGKTLVQGPTDGFLLQTSLFFWAVLLPTLAVFVWLLLLIRGPAALMAPRLSRANTGMDGTTAGLDAVLQYMRHQYPGKWRRIKPWVAMLLPEKAVSSLADVDQAPAPLWLDSPDALLLRITPEQPAKLLSRLRGRWRVPLDAVMLVGQALPTAGSVQLRQLLDLNARCQWRLPVCFALTGWTVPPQGISCVLTQPGDTAQTRADLHQLVWHSAIAGQAALLADKGPATLAFSAALEQPGVIDDLAESLAQISRHLPDGQHIIRLAWIAGSDLPDIAGHVVEDCVQCPPRRHRLTLTDRIGWLVLALSLLLILGVAVSAVRNHTLLMDAQARIAQLNAARNIQQALPALLNTQRLLQQLSQQARAGIPLLSRFGLNLNAKVQEPLFAAYGKAARQWVIAPAQQNMQRVLLELNKLPLSGGGEAISLASKVGFDSLKAYLMLDTPSRTQAAFLSDQLGQRSGFSDQPRVDIMRFYAQHLAAHPEWKLAALPAVVSAARQTLLGLNGVEHGDETIYQSILQQAADKYPPRTASSLLPGVDSRGLFLLPGTLPGAYTREAWEGYVRAAIDSADPKQGGEALWVMGAEAARSEGSLLKTRLQQRYFNDYAAAWQRWLNGMRWQSANSLSSTVEQLNTYADPQRSPLLALISMIQYQGQAGAAEKSLASDLLDKTRALVGKSRDKAAMAQSKPTDPLARAFGPLLRLAAPDDVQTGNTVSLARYLESVTSVRLKLQQLAASPNPDAAARQLAQALFKGEQNALAHGQEYAAMQAASMGAEWAGFAQQLFVSPLDSANQVVMLPAAFDINDVWRRSIYLPWGSQLAGRYPFNATDNDSSIPVLTGFLAPEQGAIARFLGSTLAGALVQEGDQWLPSPTLQNAAPFDADFLNAVNALSRLSSLLYAEGDAGYQFELRPVAMPGLAETTLMIDGQALQYFNQQEAWVPMQWPQTGQHTGTHLQWLSLATGMRQTLQFSGRWAFIRLLEKARVVQLDKARFQLDFALPDGLTARYILRTSAGEGPLALLKLLQFKLPARVFAITGPTATKPNMSATG